MIVFIVVSLQGRQMVLKLRRHSPLLKTKQFSITLEIDQAIDKKGNQMSDETFTDGPHFDEDVYYFAVDSGRAGYVAVINLTGQSLCFSVHGGRSQNIASMSRVPTIKQGRVMHLDALGALSHSDFPNIGHKQCVAAWSIVDPVVAKHLRRDFDANQTVTYDDRGRLVRRDGTTSRALSRLFLTVQPVDDEADAMLEEIKGSPHTAVHTV